MAQPEAYIGGATFLDEWGNITKQSTRAALRLNSP